MATLANLVVQVSGNTAKLNQALTKSQGRISKFAGGAGKAVRTIGPPVALVGAAVVAFGASSIKSLRQRRR